MLKFTFVRHKNTMKRLTFILMLIVTLFQRAESNGIGDNVSLRNDIALPVILGGETGNSAVTSIEDVEKVLTHLAGMNLNTVLLPACWDLIEPVEGEFDFSLIDYTIDTARKNSLKLVFLWFGAWKNSMSCYAPAWFKADSERFPRARRADGKPLEIASAFSPEVQKADAKAFEELLKHIAAYDKEGTVIMVQVENEIGMLESPRDFSVLAQAEYDKGVPEELMDYLLSHKESLHPFLADKWNKAGNLTAGSWKEVFGDDEYTDEIFMAWNYAGYVEPLAAKVKEVLNVPAYVNAALNSRGRKPGDYPSAGPLAHLMDIWNAGAPSLDFLSPDIYDSGFESWVDQYARAGNPIFIPEVRREGANVAQAYYVFGHHDALGFSPFAIENGTPEYNKSISDAYRTLGRIVPYLKSNGKASFTEGVILSKESPEVIFIDDSTRITLSHYFTLPWDPRRENDDAWIPGGAIITRIAPDEYLLAGCGIVVKFEDPGEVSDDTDRGEDGFLREGNNSDGNVANSGKFVSDKGAYKRIGLAKVEEVDILPDGSFNILRTFNGDETHQGRHVRISVDDNKILHIKTYRYK